MLLTFINNILLAFASQFGRHNPSSFGRDMGLDKADKTASTAGKTGFESSHHGDISKITGKLAEVLTGAGISYGGKVTAKLIEAALNTAFSDSSDHNMLTEMNTTISTNTTRYNKTNIHIGRLTSSRIKKMNNTPLIQLNKKDLSNSQKDYIEPAKHRQLVFNTGFNEKSYSFLMEDTYLSVKDLLTFYRADSKLDENMNKKHAGIHHVHGAIYSKQNQIKITNDDKYYDALVKIHLVKIVDINDDPRLLVEQITNNGIYIPPKFESEEDEESSKSQSKTKKDSHSNLRGNILDAVKRAAIDSGLELVSGKLDHFVDDIIKNSNISKDKKDLVRKVLTSRYRSLSKDPTVFDNGKIPEDQQYSDPNLLEKDNNFSVNFNVSMTTQLTDSINFNDRARIVSTWNRKLTPGSIWDFNITHHFGKGVNLNYLYDLENINPDHPVGYIFVLEYFGDRRAKITRRQDNGTFTGFAPVSLRFDFAKRLTYLGKESDDSLDDIPTVYKIKRKDQDFVEDSVFEKYFTPNRDAYFHVKYDDIDTIFGDTKNKKVNLSKPFVLDYDTNVIGSANTVLDQIHLDYEKNGLDSKNATEDSIKFNLKNPPSVGDYEGTEGNDNDI